MHEGVQTSDELKQRCQTRLFVRVQLLTEGHFLGMPAEVYQQWKSPCDDAWFGVCGMLFARSYNTALRSCLELISLQPCDRLAAVALQQLKRESTVVSLVQLQQRAALCCDCYSEVQMELVSEVVDVLCVFADDSRRLGSTREAVKIWDQHKDQLLATIPCQLLAVEAMRLHARAAAPADKAGTAAEFLDRTSQFLVASIKHSPQWLTPPVMSDLLAPSGVLGALRQFGQPGNDLTARGAAACLLFLSGAACCYDGTMLSAAEQQESTVLLMRALRDIAAVISVLDVPKCDRSRHWRQALRRGVAQVRSRSPNLGRKMALLLLDVVVDGLGFACRAHKT